MGQGGGRLDEVVDFACEGCKNNCDFDLASFKAHQELLMVDVTLKFQVMNFLAMRSTASSISFSLFLFGGMVQG